MAEASIFLPPLPSQLAALKTDIDVQALDARLTQLSNDLWDDPSKAHQVRAALDQLLAVDPFAAWIELLPYPLASILWRYHVAVEPRRRFENLDHFFEATAYFLVGLVLSGLRRDAALFERARTADPTMHSAGFSRASAQNRCSRWVLVVSCKADCRDRYQETVTVVLLSTKVEYQGRHDVIIRRPDGGVERDSIAQTDLVLPVLKSELTDERQRGIVMRDTLKQVRAKLADSLGMSPET